MTLQILSRTPSSHEALVRIYEGKMVFTASAAKLLGLLPDSLVLIKYDTDAYSARGVKRLYVGTSRFGHMVKQRRNTYFICSADLCRDVADALEGYGTYRICPEDFSRDADGTKYYNIFFRKYD
jgi:hypothetical protein